MDQYQFPKNSDRGNGLNRTKKKRPGPNKTEGMGSAHDYNNENEM